MKLKYTLLLIAAFFGVQAGAQTWVADSVEMGAGYANDVYYSLRSGDDYPKVANNWDIAFQMTKFGEPMFNASVRANHIKRNVQVYSLHKQASISFGTLTAADTMVTPSTQLVNQDTSWGWGAFTTNRGSHLFDYGWGQYNQTTHFVTGDSLYLVKANGTFYQLWIQEYISFGPRGVGYIFRVAKWDGSNDRTDSIKRTSPYDDRLFAYYDLASGTFIDREPSRKNWDILFKQYQKGGQPGGQDPTKLQAYTGVLSNVKVEVAKITGISPNTISSANYVGHLGGLSFATNAIGDDWKTFNMSTFTYDLDTNTSFILKLDSMNGKNEYYHLRFTRFDGGSGGATGKIVFEKRLLDAVNVSVTGPVANNTVYSLYPNPAVNEVNIVVDAEAAASDGMLTLADITGKVILHMPVKMNKGVNAFSINTSAYPAGTYIINIACGQWKLTDKVIVQH